MNKLHRWLAGGVGGILLLIGLPALAQETCPANVILAMARAAAVCQTLDRGTVCYGNGTVAADLSGASQFALPGDQIDAGTVRSVTVDSSGDDWSTATITTQANLAETDQRSVTFILYGNGRIDNLVSPLPTLSATARGTVTIRSRPGSDGDIVGRVGINTTVTLTGRTEDNVWLRAAVPNTNISGWASPETLTLDGSLTELNIVDENTPLLRPFEQIMVTTAHDDADCAGAPESGLLIQSPPIPDAARLTVNGAALQLTGTAYLQENADATLDIAVLSGIAVVEAAGEQQIIPQGTFTRLALGADQLVTAPPPPAEPYTAESVATVPVNNLTTRIRTAEPATEEQIAAAIADYTASPPPEATPVVVEVCRYIMQTADHVRRAPGSRYESVEILEEGARVYPVARTTGEDGAEWLELRYGNWVRASSVSASDACGSLPEAAYIAQPGTNTLTLETCTTSNGPIRTGQRVTIEFIPLPRETLGESQIITQVDRGRITVDERRLHIRVSDPIRLAERRYIRRFSAVWTARPGTWRIAGTHLSYQMICNVNVPVDPAR